ncbi:MAG: aspartate/glutamate racemase family protein [Oscillospiraceae bacterium]|nr:aspartate/glutamate racemase family protein [Oscillospiraceae bacterium]
MKLTIIIPVTGEIANDVTGCRSALTPLLSVDTELEFLGLDRGFPTIESETQALVNGAEVLRAAAAAYKQGSDGIFVDCFDDPGVYACRELLPIPVVGGHAPAMHTAALLSDRYAVLTTDRAGILNEERKARAAGFTPAAIRCVDMGVLDLEQHTQALLDRLEPVCRELWERERITAVVLGCTGMFAAAPALQRRLTTQGIPMQVVEPFTAGVTELERLVRLGLHGPVPGVPVTVADLGKQGGV